MREKNHKLPQQRQKPKDDSFKPLELPLHAPVYEAPASKPEDDTTPRGVWEIDL